MGVIIVVFFAGLVIGIAIMALAKRSPPAKLSPRLSKVTHDLHSGAKLDPPSAWYENEFDNLDPRQWISGPKT